MKRGVERVLRRAERVAPHAGARIETRLQDMDIEHIVARRPPCGGAD